MLTGDPEYSYHFDDLPDGFRVWARDRTTANVHFDGRFWRVKAEEAGWDHGSAPLLAFVSMVKMVAEVLMCNWKRDESRPDFPFVHNWARQQTAKAISKRIHVYWQREVEKVPEQRLRLLKQVFSTTLRDHALLWEDALYQRPYLVRDLERYRAARHVLVELHDYRNFTNHGSIEVGALEFWRDLLSDTEHSYPALNRTLDALPGNIKTNTVWRLTQRHLERAITDRLELLTVLAPSGWYGDHHRHVLMHARHDEIVRAMQMVSRYQHWNLSTRRQQDVEKLVTFLNDYDRRHTGNIVGLAQKAIDWHKHEAEERLKMQLAELNDTSPAQSPPILPPDDERVTFLSTAGAIRSEGIAMNHCIAQYARDAMRGRCFLFHIEYKGDKASVQVMLDGRVAQAYGPMNSTNRASQYGRRVLTQWGDRFPRSAPKQSLNQQLYFPDNRVAYAEYDLADLNDQDVAF